MKLRANKRNIRKYARELLGNNYSPEREKELLTVCLNGFERDPYVHISHDRAAHIAKIDKVLGNCGCEGMLLDNRGQDVSGFCDASRVYHDIHYSNAGDTYAMTVFYHNGKLYVGDWGSIVERLS